MFPSPDWCQRNDGRIQIYMMCVYEMCVTALLVFWDPLISYLISGLLTLSPIIPHPFEQESRHIGMKLKYSYLTVFF